MRFDQHGWLDDAVEIDYLHKSMDRQGHKITYICLHGTAGGSSAQAIAAYFRDSNVEASTHFVIGQDGTTVQGIPLSLAAWGNGVLTAGHQPYLPGNVNPNLYTVSIEHVKAHSDNSDILTSDQKKASFELVQCICEAYSIPKRKGDASGGIISHADIDPVNRARCPGPYPWEELWTFLKEGDDMLSDVVVQKYFSDGGNGTWRCKQTGAILMGANLAFYRSHGGHTLFGLPLSNEIYPPEYPGTAIVPCERALIVYDPEHKIDHPPIEGPCYLLHINTGIGKKIITSL